MKCNPKTIEQKAFIPAGRSIACVLALSLVPLSAALAGDAYSEGCDAARAADYMTACERWGPLAASGDGHAQFQLAMMYHAGLHVRQDEAKAVELYHLAARNGVREAREYLIAGYANGWFGLPRDESLAAYWQYRLELQERGAAEGRTPSSDRDKDRSIRMERALAQVTSAN